ncbi:MAG: type II toxin-antitoxin system prevent-host-death family antitoxin [Anaerolineales bacterium]|jgi:prevent-host-death family protein
MNTVQIVAVTDFRNKTKEVLHQAKEAPVILTQRSRPAAVVVDYDTYQAQIKLLEELELKLDDLLLAHAIQSSKELAPLEDLFEDYEKSTGIRLNLIDR